MLKNLSYFEMYIIGINIVGLVLYLVDIWLYDNTPESEIDRWVTLAELMGGTVGIAIGMIIMHLKPVKQTMMSFVSEICFLILDIIIFLIAKGFIKSELTFRFWQFFSQHKWIVYYLIAINFITFATFAYDKIQALERRNRIRILVLLGLALAGGTIGGLVAMYLFHHKTRKDYFTVGLPLMLVMQVTLLFYVMNAALPKS